MGKYDPLQKHLENIPSNINIRSFTFKEIEIILGDDLPRSAYMHRPWWANPRSPKDHPHAQAWLAAGWKVDSVDQAGRLVSFRRTTKSIQNDVYASTPTLHSNANDTSIVTTQASESKVIKKS